MLFNSFIFIFLFLPFVFLLYYLLNQYKLYKIAIVLLVFSSLFFYAWWKPEYLPIIIISLFFNYIIGFYLSKKKICQSLKKYILIFGIMSNVSLLIYFKYTDFLLFNFNFLFGTHFSLPHLTLPLAISFFTFQQIAYLVDSYRGQTKEYDFLNYSLFVTFFPQLIAGPIVHHKEMMPQFQNINNTTLQFSNIILGIFIFTMGLFKKVMIADTFSKWATQGFDVAEKLNFFEAWCTSLSYTFQLYYDFSGYTDMAIGTALLFNIRLPFNFNSPYKAVNIQDFWRRWHITLSRFLRDYIYIPLGGNRDTEIKVYRNIIITFLIGGIWHGAGWTFLIWGLLHGIALVIHRIWSSFHIKLHTIFAWFITFMFINFTWIFFRAKSWNDAQKVLDGMTSIPFTLSIHVNSLHGIGGNFSTYLWLGIVFVTTVFFNNTNTISIKHLSSRNTVIIAFLFILSVYHLTDVSEFLYFNF